MGSSACYQTYAISELIDEIAMGPFGSNIKVDCFVNEGIPVFNGSNLTGFTTNDDELRYVTDEKAKSLGRALASRGDVVVTHRGTLGQIAYIPNDSLYEHYIISQSQFRMRMNEKVLPAYLVYYFHTPLGQWKILSNKAQTGVPALGRPTSTFQKIEIRLPNIETQSRVVSLLNSMQSVISLNRQTNDYLTELRNTVVKSMISDVLDEERGSWNVVPLKNVAAIQSGYSYKSAELVDSSSIGMLGIKCFERDGSFRPDGFKPIEPAKVKPSQYVHLGDIVVAHTDLTQNADIIGRAIQVIDDGGYDQMIESCDLVKVTSTQSGLSNEFLAALLGTEDFHRHCLAYVNGTTVLHLGKKALPEYELKIPDDEQTLRKLDELFRTIANAQAELIRENRHLAQLRDALLPKLMSGEIDVSQVELPTQPNNHLPK